MYFNIHPYEFYTNTKGHIVIRQRFDAVERYWQNVVLSRWQMEVFISHLQQFLERSDDEARTNEVRMTIEKSQKIATNKTA